MKPEALQAIAQFLSSLAYRWADESQYENFAEYETAMRKLVEQHGATYKRMTRRPFAVEFVSGVSTYTAKVARSKVTVTEQRAALNVATVTSKIGGVYRGDIDGVAFSVTMLPDVGAVIRWADNTQPTDEPTCNAILDAVEAHDRKSKWYVGRVVRRDAGGFLFNAVRTEDGAVIEADTTPTHDEDTARRLVERLNAADAARGDGGQ
jgi:hypothetical protein